MIFIKLLEPYYLVQKKMLSTFPKKRCLDYNQARQDKSDGVRNQNYFQKKQRKVNLNFSNFTNHTTKDTKLNCLKNCPPFPLNFQ